MAQQAVAEVPVPAEAVALVGCLHWVAGVLIAQVLLGWLAAA